MKILFLTNVPSPYRVRFFNELARYCDLTVVYEKEKSDERDAKWVENARDSYRVIFLKGIRTAVDGAFAPEVLRFLKRDVYDLIVICGISSPTEMLAIKWCQLRGIPYAIEGDGAFPKSGRGLRERVKRNLIRKAALCFSTCRMHDRYYLQYGVPESNVVRYPFTSVEEADILPAPVSGCEKARLRRELSMREERIVLAVGQFIHRKGFDTLLEAARELPEQVGIYIVGGVPTEDYLALRNRLALKNVHFAGFMSKNELARYYQAADAFVLPTREDIWGLVVNEAMACGLPVVTTTRCNAGLELIRSGVEGFLVEPEDSRALAGALRQVLGENLGQMSQASLDRIRDYTIEKMALRHKTVFAAYLEENQR